MSYSTRFNGNYNITGVDATSNVQVNTHSFIVNGNLKVLGLVTNVASTNSQITDNIITLNQGETGAGVTAIYSGIEVARGTSPTVAIRWNEAYPRWELTVDGSQYTPILYGNPGIGSVSADPSPALGGNLDVQARTIYSSSTQYIKHDSNVALQNTTIAPTTLSGYNVMYAQTPAGGGSGLYVTNTTAQQQELVTKTKAIVYALIM